MTIGERIKARREALGMSVDDVAAELGKNRATIYRYENGEIKRMSVDVLKPLAEVLHTTPAYLMEWTDDPYDWDNDPDARMDQISSNIYDELDRLYDGDRPTIWRAWIDMQADAANEAAKMREAERKPVPIPPGFLPPPKMKKVPLIGDIACGDPITAEQNVADYLDVPEDVHCDFCLRCHGDSMIDAHIQDGDVVYIHCQPEVNDGEIAAVRIGDEATLKRVYYDGQNLTLMPCNSAYRPRTYSGPELDDIQIEGRMVGFMHHGSR